MYRIDFFDKFELGKEKRNVGHIWLSGLKMAEIGGIDNAVSLSACKLRITGKAESFRMYETYKDYKKGVFFFCGYVF